MKTAVERTAVVFLCLAIGWFYAWTVRSNGERWKFGEEERDYYNLLIDGYLEGQLHMKVSVPAALLHLRNPYDPQERPAGLGLHDASFYKGKYYVYFGAAPMLLLMLPFRLLTGMDLPLSLAILVFVWAGFVTSVGVWLAMRRRYFPETSTLTVLAGILILGLAGVSAVLLRRADMWELPIAGGFFFAMATVALIWRSLHAGQSRASWFGGAGLALGLAIASRPTYLITAPLLIPPLLWWWRSERRLPWRSCVSAAVPLVIIGTLMAWHNYARFENPLEFGQAYQFSLDYESKLPHFRAAYVPFTLRAHFFSAAEWSPYFPFIQRADLGAAPAGFTMHRGDIHGILINFPIAWLAFLSPLVLWRRPANERGLLGAWIASVGLLFLCAAGLLLFFFSALARYQMEFMPALMLLAGVGLLGVTHWLQEAKLPMPWRAAMHTGWMLAAAFSVGFGVIFSLQYEGLLRANNPVLEEKVARQWNRMSALLQRVTGAGHGAVELTIRLPIRREPRRETLLTSGDRRNVDRVVVRYLDDGRIQFGVLPHGSPEQLSRPLSLDQSVSHRLLISMGSLYPPPSHPFFAGTSAAEVQQTTRRIRIAVNGEPVLIAHHRGAGVNGSAVLIGDKAAHDAAHGRFLGTVEAVRRLGRDTSAVAPADGPFVRLRLTFNADPSAGCEPLVAFGDSGSRGLLTVTPAGPLGVKFGFVGSGAELRQSDSAESETDRLNELVVRFEASPQHDRRRLLLFLNSVLVWAPEIEWTGADSRVVTVGKNPAGMAKCGAEFRGTVSSAQHDRQGRDPLDAAGGLKIRATLPGGRLEGSDPLVVTGRTWAGDILVIEHLGAQRVRFGLDHWGAAMSWSQPVVLDAAPGHTFDITMPSLQTVANAMLARETPGELSVSVDGKTVWRHAAVFYPAESGELAIGRNPIGGTSAGPVFRGQILSAERAARE